MTDDFTDPPSGDGPSSQRGLRFRAAYERLESEIAAIPVEKLAHLCIDVMDAVATVLGAIPAISQLRDQASLLPFFDASALERLQDCALALGHAHTLYLAESKPRERLSVLKKRAVELRRNLRVEMRVLIRRELLPDDCLNGLLDSKDPKEIGFDLRTMVEVLRTHRDAIAGKSAIQDAELDSTEQLGEDLVRAVGDKLGKREQRTKAALMRRKAFTLLVNTYEQVQRMVKFLRDDYGDAEQIAPSLYLARAKRRKEKRTQAGAVQPSSAAETAPSAD